MKVVHLGDSDGGGGAANAMSRLHGALQRLGVDSRLLVRNSAAQADAVETIATRGDANARFPVVRDAVERRYVELNRTGVSNTHFSLHIDGADVSRAPLVAASDVVHLHWTASFQTPADVRALFDAKPVVWTLHDLAPLTGGCHFPAACEAYAAGDCRGCPQLARDPFRITATTLKEKNTLWAGLRPTFVAPSRDMAERARRSAVARHAHASVVHIPHGIDVDTFRPQAKAAARRALRVPVDGIYVLCGSSHNAERRKGLGILGRVLAAAKVRWRLGGSKLTLLTVGDPKLDVQEIDGIEVIQLGRVSPAMMPSVFAAADVFLHPSAEDNFPLMLLESSSCGTPAIAFDVGGVADIVQDETSGNLIAAGDELAMAEALASLVSQPQRLARMAEGARAHVDEHFSDASVARKHAELYDEVVANGAVRRASAGAVPPSEIEQIFPRLFNACLVEELASEREHAASLERERAALASSLAEQTREVREKDAELTAVHAAADERKRLAETLHDSAAGLETLAATLQRDIRERDVLRAALETTIDEQRAEIELVHRVAEERGLLIDDLHRVAEERAGAVERETLDLVMRLAEQQRHVLEKEDALSAIHAVAEERKHLAETLHAAAASIEASAASLQRAVRERDELLAQLGATIEQQRAEIELVHRVAAERGLLIDDLERVAGERRAAAASFEAQLAQLAATIREQKAEIELVHHVAADRGQLIDDLHRVADERLALIDRLASETARPTNGRARARRG